MDTLGDALPREIERVQELIKEYESVPNGNIAASLMKADIKRANEAMISGDIVGMVSAYSALKDYK